jgi:hypothetical protein
MPRRTNEFQQLALAVQHQLAPNANVTESKFLIDRRTGSKVQVDIVVETRVGDIPLVIGFECTAEARPATVEWVQEMIGKHTDLQVDKTVLVAKSGFTKMAAKKAISHGVEAVALEEAKDVDWKTFIEVLGDLALAQFEFKGVRWQVIHVKPTSGSISIGPHSIIQEPGRQITHTLQEYIDAAIRDENAFWTILEKWVTTPKDQRKNDYGFTVTWHAPENTTIQDGSGLWWRMSQLEVEVVARVESTPLKLESGQIFSTQVAFGSAENIFEKGTPATGKFLVALLGKQGKLAAGTLVIPGSAGVETRLYTMKYKHVEKNKGS